MPAYLSAFGGKADVSQPLPDIAIYEYASPPLGSDRRSSNVGTPPAPAPYKNFVERLSQVVKAAVLKFGNPRLSLSRTIPIRVELFGKISACAPV
jgi:hypothetical protein